MESFPKMLISIGLTITLVGVLWWVGVRYFKFGHFPGDIAIEKENFKFYFPLGTSILLSIVLSAIMWVLNKRGQ